jgi:hypothetical protein
MQRTELIIINEPTLESFEKSINKHLKKGWNLYGTTFISLQSDTSVFQDTQNYCQMMVKNTLIK